MVYVAHWEDWAVYVYENTFHLKVSQQSTSSPKGTMLAVKVADVISVVGYSLLTLFQYTF
jgi:hypothetical protein